MMARKQLCVAFLWHMHQPDYRSRQTGQTYLPWTRFHAIKDYFDMGALVESAGARATINLVPSLIDQLKAYGAGAVNEIQAAVTLRDASTLTIQEKQFLLRTFFQLAHQHMLLPYPRYRELLDRRGPADADGEYPLGLQSYSEQDYRDLQLWYNLAWCGDELRRDPRIAALFDKGRNFAEEDKRLLLEVQTFFIERILPYYRRISESGCVEFSVSPYYHPILPLLCDLRAAVESLPAISLPPVSFAYPNDAREHILRAMRLHAELFGRAPRGMWPSEGAISDSALKLAGEAGICWLASDEGVLLNSLRSEGRAAGALTPQQKYSAYRWGEGTGPVLFFRDHTLSDLFGFSYQTWRAADAAADFLQRLHRIRETLPDDGKHYIVPVILDGENAWEHYPGNGAPFLDLMYRRLAESREFRTVTFSDFLDLEQHREPLKSIVAGSWIYGNLATWIGHPEKNRGWELLSAARSRLSSSQLAGKDRAKIDAAFNELMIAEGSDWFWWYGDDHQTENAAEFDALFRSHLKNAYRLLGDSPPPELDLPIKKIRAGIRHKNPVHTITPRLDGIVSDYFEWLSAGFAAAGGGASMHRTDHVLEKVHFGFDMDFLYLRIDLAQNRLDGFPATGSIQLRFAEPVPRTFTLRRDGKSVWTLESDGWPEHVQAPGLGVKKIIEIGLPLGPLGVEKAREVTFFISVLEDDRELERFPSSGFIALTADPWGLDQQEWIV